uniref:Uncharacterized protein n=1 Tax=Onchocerca volvulus TaxID=6282 RepID=A0A8R1Y3U2_ONCVO
MSLSLSSGRRRHRCQPLYTDTAINKRDFCLYHCSMLQKKALLRFPFLFFFLFPYSSILKPSTSGLIGAGDDGRKKEKERIDGDGDADDNGRSVSGRFMFALGFGSARASVVLTFLHSPAPPALILK